MENLDRRMLLAGLGLVGAAAAASAGAGTLNPPPGPVAPTGKTTDEIEPRVAVQSLAGDGTSVHLISQPGSYYMTGNINAVAGKSAIAIAAGNVTLDLGGFALIGVAGATFGVDIRGTLTQICVRNGSIRSFDSGGVSNTGIASSSRVESVSIRAIVNGRGIFLSGDSNHVGNCEISGIGGIGILLASVDSGLVENCVVNNCSSNAQIVGISARSVTACAVVAVSSSGGPANGISGASVGDCHVSNVTSAASNATGISGGSVSASFVSVIGSALFSTGINAPNGHVAGCGVLNIGNGVSDAGGATGITTENAANCTAIGVGAAGSTTAPVGISADSTTNCSVSQIGQTTSVVGATGVNGNVISGCDVSIIRGGSVGSTVGIFGSVVNACNVDSLSQGSSSGSVVGITADAVAECRVTSIAGSTTGTVSGIGGSSNVRDCMVSNISNAGAGAAIGLNRTLTNAGSVESTIFRACGDVGVSVTARQRIVGCTIQAATTGILATNVRNVIDSNNIDSCTTGVSVTSGTNTANALVVRNQVRNCTTNFLLDTPCQFGPNVSAVGQIASNNPWANFTD